MTVPAVAEASSTATSPAPQGLPEVTPSTPSLANKVAAKSINEMVNASLQKAQEKLGQPKPESVPNEPAKTETGEITTDDPATENAEPVEVVSYKGQELPLSDLFGKMDFEVFANGEYKEVDGAKLLDMASIGFAATKKVETAKQVIQKTDEIIREIEASAKTNAQKIATDYLNSLLDQVTNGRVNPATNQPFKNEAERKGAVDLANSLIYANAKGKSTVNQPMTAEDIQKLVEEAADKKFKQTETQKAEQKQRELAAQLTQNAESSLQKVMTPLMQYFTGEDGKTVNSRLFNSFKSEVRVEADKLFTANGGKSDAVSVNDYITKAAKSVLQDYLPSLRTQKTNEPAKVPVSKANSGLPLADGQPAKYKSREEAIQAKVKQYLAGQPKG